MFPLYWRDYEKGRVILGEARRIDVKTGDDFWRENI